MRLADGAKRDREENFDRSLKAREIQAKHNKARKGFPSLTLRASLFLFRPPVSFPRSQFGLTSAQLLCSLSLWPPMLFPPKCLILFYFMVATCPIFFSQFPYLADEWVSALFFFFRFRLYDFSSRSTCSSLWIVPIFLRPCAWFMSNFLSRSRFVLASTFSFCVTFPLAQFSVSWYNAIRCKVCEVMWGGISSQST